MLQKPQPPAIARILAAALLAVTLPATAAAQDPIGEPATRDTIRSQDVFEEMQTQLERLLPAMRELARSLQETLPELGAEAADSPDVTAVARRAAAFTRAYYEALLDEGFTREEALRIVSGNGPPGT